MTTLRDIGRRIAEERAKADYTQAQLAERVGLSDKAMQRIEYGGSTSTARLLDIAKALDVHPRVFFLKPKSEKRRRPGRPRR